MLSLNFYIYRLTKFMPALHICFLAVKYNREFLSVRKIERCIHIYVFKLILNKTTAFPLLPLYSVLLFCSDLSSVGGFFQEVQS